MYAPHNGYLLLNKQPGLTSFGALHRLKRVFAGSKVGHAGTLDKFASGLLIVLVGRAVKLNPWFSGSWKEYHGTIRLGIETDTLDPEGSPVGEAGIPSLETLTAVLGRFRGDILQTPPAYSAVHIEGKRAHALARSGAMPEMRSRPVTVHALELLSYEPPLANIYVRCSKGTYIRSLARDIALAAESRGYLAALNRSAVAGFSLAGAAAMDAPEESLRRALLPVDAAAFAALGIPQITLNKTAALKILQGKTLETILAEEDLPQGLQNAGAEHGAAGLFDEQGGLLAVIEKDIPNRTGEHWRYRYVYARAAGGAF